ncbi:MAG: 23S rRNA (guanosine(2251)-2'-O)-methyltransferase RlmB [Deltaproteobacteria bacterium]|nr:23S rRNA (guanosine(2251)-2'-O)-methyltransferase RlmB [Deltaproteobacteria bacterium]
MRKTCFRAETQGRREERKPSPDLLPIPGFHGVREALTRRAGHMDIKAVWVARGKRSTRMDEIMALARKRGIPVEYKPPQQLDRLAPHVAHQGMVALAAGFAYTRLDDMLKAERGKAGYALLLALDHITDEGNLSALIRSAAFFGVQGLIIPRDRSAQITPTVLKRASGACAHLPVSQVVNMARTLEFLNNRGFWIIGTSGQGPTSIYRFDWNRDVVLVLGNEERGIGKAVQKQCHDTVHIPSPGSLDALNVSVAGAVILSEISRQQHPG